MFLQIYTKLCSQICAYLTKVKSRDGFSAVSVNLITIFLYNRVKKCFLGEANHFPRSINLPCIPGSSVPVPAPFSDRKSYHTPCSSMHLPWQQFPRFPQYSFLPAGNKGTRQCWYLPHPSPMRQKEDGNTAEDLPLPHSYSTSHPFRI